jgi:hypothetical protein
MDKQSTKVLALVALILATGVTVVEITRPARAEAASAEYAGERIATVFQVVAQMPAMPAVQIPVAEKGDLMPIGCAGPLRPEVADECMDTAYEVPSEPSVVVETRTGDASTELMRLDGMTVAGY